MIGPLAGLGWPKRDESELHEMRQDDELNEMNA